MLEGIRVIEMATMIAAPAAAGMLSEWGADVIKIEPHRGDGMRGGPGSALGSTNFDIHNRGKRVIALETRFPESREIVLKLVSDADVFITNILPGQLEKLRLDFEDLHALNPRLVYGQVTGFGRVGPQRDRPAMDNAGFWARGGGTALLTVKGLDPIPQRQSVGDRITSLGATAGILCALVEAQRTGKGRLVDTSLLRSGIWTFGTDIANQIIRGRVGSSKRRHEAVMPLSNFFKTKDEKWVLIHTGLEALAPAVGREDLLEDPRFSGPGAMREHGTELVDALDPTFAERTRAEWQQILDAAGVICEPVQRPGDIIEDPQAQAAGCFVEVPSPYGEEGSRREPAAPPAFYNDDGSWADGPRGPSPRIGQHTVEILRELGYADADITALRDKGVLLKELEIA